MLLMWRARHKRPAVQYAHQHSALVGGDQDTSATLVSLPTRAANDPETVWPLTSTHSGSRARRKSASIAYLRVPKPKRLYSSRHTMRFSAKKYGEADTAVQLLYSAKNFIGTGRVLETSAKRIHTSSLEAPNHGRQLQE